MATLLQNCWLIADQRTNASINRSSSSSSSSSSMTRCFCLKSTRKYHFSEIQVVCDGWMDRQTDTPSYQDARTHLKIRKKIPSGFILWKYVHRKGRSYRALWGETRSFWDMNEINNSISNYLFLIKRYLGKLFSYFEVCSISQIAFHENKITSQVKSLTTIYISKQPGSVP